MVSTPLWVSFETLFCQSPGGSLDAVSLCAGAELVLCTCRDNAALGQFIHAHIAGIAAPTRDTLIRDMIGRMRHDRCGGVELIIGIEGASSRPMRKIIVRDGSALGFSYAAAKPAREAACRYPHRSKENGARRRRFACWRRCRISEPCGAGSGQGQQDRHRAAPEKPARERGPEYCPRTQAGRRRCPPCRSRRRWC